MGVRWIFGWGSREYLLKRESRRRAIDGVASYESNLEVGASATSNWLLATASRPRVRKSLRLRAYPKRRGDISVSQRQGANEIRRDAMIRTGMNVEPLTGIVETG